MNRFDEEWEAEKKKYEASKNMPAVPDDLRQQYQPGRPRRGYGHDHEGQNERDAFNSNDPHAPRQIESSRGTFFAVADYSQWRVALRNRQAIKLDDPAKARYLTSLEKHGKRGMAAAAAGVCSTTISKHMEMDPEFKAAAEVAWDSYREQRVLQIENEAILGFDEVIFSPTGERGFRKRYETQLRLAVLRKLDPDGYREKSTLDVNFQGGAVVVPLPPSADEWEAMFAAQQAAYQLPESMDTTGYNVSDAIQEGELSKNTNKDQV